MYALQFSLHIHFVRWRNIDINEQTERGKEKIGPFFAADPEKQTLYCSAAITVILGSVQDLKIELFSTLVLEREPARVLNS